MDKIGRPVIIRLKNILGASGKYNDVLFTSCASVAKSNVIFFGGDLQTYKESMKDVKYSKWSLDYTAELLSNRFQDSHIWVVKPYEMQKNTYSIYKNFVISGAYGIPTHTSGQLSWHHLYLLLKHSLTKLRNDVTLSTEVDLLNSLSCPVIIVGFSKGCVVLNQLIYDLKDDVDEEVRSFINLVKLMCWLDGGHGGSSNTWITDENVLSAIPSHGLKVETHVTPYQIKDKTRPWIGKEYAIFVDKLKELGEITSNHVHFSDSPRSLDYHFSILELFCLKD